MRAQIGVLFVRKQRIRRNTQNSGEGFQFNIGHKPLSRFNFRNRVFIQIQPREL